MTTFLHFVPIGTLKYAAGDTFGQDDEDDHVYMSSLTDLMFALQPLRVRDDMNIRQVAHAECDYLNRMLDTARRRLLNQDITSDNGYWAGIWLDQLWAFESSFDQLDTSMLTTWAFAHWGGSDNWPGDGDVALPRDVSKAHMLMAGEVSVLEI